MIKGLIFDFDGLILDTEEPEHRAWAEIYRDYGCELPLELWGTCIGTQEAVFDPYEHLVSLSGRSLSRRDISERRRSRSLEIIARQDLLPGVRDYLQSAKRLGLKVAIASSSPRMWITGYLEQHEIGPYFHAIRCFDDVEFTKPHPELFLSALQALQLRPQEAIVFEDSPNGLKAARAAGIYCVAIPNAVTAQLSLADADLRLTSLQEIPLDLLIERVENVRRELFP